MPGNRSLPTIALPKHRPSREIGRTAHRWEALSWLGQNALSRSRRAREAKGPLFGRADQRRASRLGPESSWVRAIRQDLALNGGAADAGC